MTLLGRRSATQAAVAQASGSSTPAAGGAARSASPTGARRLSRRALLAGGAALCAGLPLWGGYGGALAQGATAPKRLILLFNPNGTVQEQFWPSTFTSETDFQLSSILAPLEAHKTRLLLLKGLDLAVAKVGPGGPHQKGMGGLFTGNTLQAGSFADGDGSLAGWADGTSIDQEVAKVVGQNTPLPSLELGVRAAEAEVRGRISYAGPGAPLPPQNDPALVYQRVFSGMTLPAEELARLRTQRLSVLDTVKGQFGELEARIGAADRARLEAHLELIRGVERRLDLVAGVTGQCSVPNVPAALVPEDENTMPDLTKLQIDLLVLTLACDLTRVASLQFSSAVNAIRFPWLNSLGQGHTLSHTGTGDTASQAELVQRATWHAQQLAYLMDQLALIQEEGGALLDNTLILWGNELGVGNSHSHANVPFVLAGGGGGFRMGRFLTYDHLPHNRLLVSVLNAFGVDKTGFGHPDFAEGTLSNLV